MYTTHDRYVKMFTSLDEDVGDYEHVTFGDNSKGKVVGLDKVAITKDLSISNVLLVDSVSEKDLDHAMS